MSKQRYFIVSFGSSYIYFIFLKSVHFSVIGEICVSSLQIQYCMHETEQYNRYFLLSLLSNLLNMWNKSKRLTLLDVGWRHQRYKWVNFFPERGYLVRRIRRSWFLGYFFHVKDLTSNSRITVRSRYQGFSPHWIPQVQGNGKFEISGAWNNGISLWTATIFVRNKYVSIHLQDRIVAEKCF